MKCLCFFLFFFGGGGLIEMFLKMFKGLYTDGVNELVVWVCHIFLSYLSSLKQFWGFSLVFMTTFMFVAYLLLLSYFCRGLG